MLGIYTQLTMIFVVTSHFILLILNLNVLIKWKTIHLRPLAWILIGFTSFGLLIAFTIRIIPQLTSVILSTGQLVARSWDIPLWVINEAIKALGIGPLGIYLLMAALFFSIIGIFSYSRSKPIVLGLFFLPLFTSTLVSMLLSHFIWPRFYFYLLGFVVFLLLRGFDEFSSWFGKLLQISPRNSYQIRTYFLAGLVLISAATVPLAYGPKQDYAEALKFIQANQRPEDGVVAIGFTAIPFDDYLHQNWQMITTLDELNGSLEQHQRVWVVYTLESVLESKYPELMNFTRQDIPVEKQFNGTLAGGEISIGLIESHK
ncbi:MAG: hypothetical protein P8Z00_25280 [Anaerolineales bacterium]